MSTSKANGRRVRVAPNLYQHNGRFLMIARKEGRQIVKALKARTKTAAKAELKIELGKLETGGIASIGNRSITLAQVIEQYLAYHLDPATGSLAPTTLAQRRTLLTKHVLAEDGLRPTMKATDLTAAHVRSLVATLRRKKLAGATVRKTVDALSGTLSHAVRQGQLPRNVCRDLVRGDLPSGRRQSEPRYLTPAEIEALLGQLGDEFRPVAAACFFAGLRISEALALRWRDVSFESARISIRTSKTEAGIADVPLLLRLRAELIAHRERQARLGFDRITPDALVFLTLSGRPQSRGNVLRAVNRAGQKAGLQPEGSEPIGNHDLRHSLAAYAFAQGMSPAEVCRLCRHANPQITLTIYGGLAGDHVDVLGSKLATLGVAGE